MSQVLETKPLSVIPADLVHLPDTLTIKQKLFIYHYIETRSALKAAELAGYTGDKATLSAIGGENLRKPQIKAEIDRIWSEKIASANVILAETSEIALIPLDELATKSKDAPVDVDAKLKALELMGKHHKVFTDKLEVESTADPKRIANEVLAALIELRQQQLQQAVVGDGSEHSQE